MVPGDNIDIVPDDGVDVDPPNAFGVAVANSASDVMAARSSARLLRPIRYRHVESWDSHAFRVTYLCIAGLRLTPRGVGLSSREKCGDDLPQRTGSVIERHVRTL